MSREPERVVYYGITGKDSPNIRDRARVWVVDHDEEDSEPLNPRHDLRNHSPDGFAWGYGGSGPSQLALAILAHATDNDDVAQQLCQDFMVAAIMPLDRNADFEILQADVVEWVAVALHEAGRKEGERRRAELPGARS